MVKKAKHALQSQQVRAVIGVLFLTGAYALGSRALDTGSLQQYAGTILLIICGVRQIVRSVRA